MIIYLAFSFTKKPPSPAARKEAGPLQDGRQRRAERFGLGQGGAFSPGLLRRNMVRFDHGKMMKHGWFNMV